MSTYIIIYTKENGKLELTREEWLVFDDSSVTYHREDGPAVEYADGDKGWWIDGKRHRINGPAIESNGDRAWWINGNRHRIDGPAREYTNGGKEWWIDGARYSEESLERIIKEVKALPLELKLTDPRWWVRELK